MLSRRTRRQVSAPNRPRTASATAMNAAVIAAVRVPPSALSTSASTWIVHGPSAWRSTTARRLRPISRWISVARPSAPRRIREGVLPGSIAYSAVSQPIDFPSRNGGTDSEMLRRHQDHGRRPHR